MSAQVYTLDDRTIRDAAGSANEPLHVSEFAEWIEDEIEEVTANAAYFNQN